MKLDFNKILILFLLATTIGFGLTWWFGSNKSNEKIQKIQKEFSDLEKEKIRLTTKIAVWEKLYKEQDEKDKKAASEIVKAKTDAAISKTIADRAKTDLINIQNNISKTKKDIENIKNNTKSLTDDELLQQLIKNTK